MSDDKTKLESTSTPRQHADATILEGSPAPEQTILEHTAPADQPTEILNLVRGADFGDYRLLRSLKVTSAEADLWMIEHRQSGTKFVLKLYRYGITPKPEVIKALQGLRREHIVPITETGEREGRHYEIQEFIEHGSLADLIKQGSVPEQRAREILKELADAIAHLHQVNVLHRDIKPSNILVRSFEPLDLVLTDFGISSITDLSLHQTSVNRTVMYSAPESLTGVVSKASDWWSIGIILIELLTGKHPFRDMTEQAVNFHLVTKAVPIPASLPSDWQMIIKGLLTRDHAKRWGSAQVMAWLEGRRNIPVGYETELQAETAKKYNYRPYRFTGKEYYEPAELAVALAQNFEQGMKEFGRGMVTNWITGQIADQDLARTLHEISEDNRLQEWRRLSVALMAMNPSLPVICRGEVVNPQWLPQHPETAIEILQSSIPDWLFRLRNDRWLLELGELRQKTWADLDSFGINLYRALAEKLILANDTGALVALCNEQRKQFVCSRHEVLDRVLVGEEAGFSAMIALVTAEAASFNTNEQIIVEVRRQLASFKIVPDGQYLSQLLQENRQALLARVEEAIRDYKSCNIFTIDQLAEKIRQGKRLGLIEIILLLVTQDLTNLKNEISLLVKSGRFRRALELLETGRRLCGDEHGLTQLRQEAETGQSRLLALAEEEIPRLWQQRRCVTMLRRLEEVSTLCKEVEGAAEARRTAEEAIAQARALTDQANQLLPRTKPRLQSLYERSLELFRTRKRRQALTLYRQALQLCADYDPAISAEANAQHTLTKILLLRTGLCVTTSVAILVTFLVLNTIAHKTREDENAWRNATAVEQSASEDYEKAAEAYQNYRALHPRGQYGGKAGESIQSLTEKIDDRDWLRTQESVKQAGSNDEMLSRLYDDYIAKHRNSRWVAEAAKLRTPVAERLSQREYAAAMQAGQKSEETRNWKEAMAKYQTAAKNKPNDLDADAAIKRVTFEIAMDDGRAAEQRRDWPSAKADYKKALTSAPGDPSATAALAAIPIVVSTSGGGDYHTITEAIQNAQSGSHIFVRPGLYSYKDMIRINKKLELIGDGEAKDIIVESTGLACIVIQTDEATVRGLTIRMQHGDDNTEGGLAVVIAQGQPLIQDCDITSELAHGAAVIIGAVGPKPTIDPKPTIRSCRIHNAVIGVNVAVKSQAVIEGCEIFGCIGGVSMSNGSDTIIRRCTIRDGKETGILIKDCQATIEESNVYQNLQGGVLILDRGRGVIRRCRLYKNGGAPEDDLGFRMNWGLGYAAITVKTGSTCTAEDNDLTGNYGGVWAIDPGAEVRRSGNKE